MKNRLVTGLFVAVFCFPAAVLIVLSISQGFHIQSMGVQFSARGWNFLASQKNRFLLSILSSVSYSFCAVILSFAVSLLPAKLLARHLFSGRTVLEAFLVTPGLLPAITFAMGIHQLFIRVNLSDNFAGVVLVLTFVSFPYMLRALIAGFQGFSKSYEECALNLGAGWFMTFRYLELPFILPAAAAGGSIVFLVCFSDYFLVFLIGGGAVASVTGYLVPFITSSDYSVSSAIALVFLAIPVLLFIIQEAVLIYLFRKRGMDI